MSARLLFLALLCSCLMQLNASAAAQQTSYNCSRSYTLRVNSERQLPVNDPCSAEVTTPCVESSQDDFQTCSSLSEILARFNSTSVVEGGDCLRLEMDEGEYVIASSGGAVTYSLVMVGLVDGVSVRCRSTRLQEGCPTSQPLMFSKTAGHQGEAAVLLQGVKFEDCSRPLRFDNLDRVTIDSCSFRYSP